MVFIQPGEIFSVDLVVMDTRTIHQEKYALVLVDQFTTYTFSFLLRHKSESVDKITALLTYIQKQTGITVKELKQMGEGNLTMQILNNSSLKKELILSLPLLIPLSTMERMSGSIRH